MSLPSASSTIVAAVQIDRVRVFTSLLTPLVYFAGSNRKWFCQMIAICSFHRRRLRRGSTSLHVLSLLPTLSSWLWIVGFMLSGTMLMLGLSCLYSSWSAFKHFH